MPTLFLLKTVSKINPELEYETAKRLIEEANWSDPSKGTELDASVDNLITAARVLMEREDRRRGKKSSPPKKTNPKGRKKGEERDPVEKLPSRRYPNIEVREKILTLSEDPTCPCCNVKMEESGLYSTSEKIEVIPKQHYIQRTKRVKFNCPNCYGAMINTPAETSIVPKSNYGDSTIIDVTLSKYCDLIPTERYAAMAARNGIQGIPPQSLIGLTNHLAVFLKDLLVKIKQEVQDSYLIRADETPHKMLEGDPRKNWYLWGFFCEYASYFEAHDTRSGDVPYEFLKYSSAKYLLTDAYGGYAKSVRLLKEDGINIIEIHCNAHSFRYFKDAGEVWKDEIEVFLKLYGEIYALEKQMNCDQQKLEDHEKLRRRHDMIPLFEEIKIQCELIINDIMPESYFKKAVNYFLNHYETLTRCTNNINIPLDNNLSERGMRPYVVGRKTWIGTHSKRGAKTSSAHFTIVHSCHLSKVNPRSYYPWVVQRIHKGEEILTPYEYSKLQD